MSLQHTLFIADLHLDSKHTHTTKLFHHFMTSQALDADALYILGDFFEFWVGDDHTSSFIEEIKEQLRQVSSKIPVYFLRGNRDFLIGQRFGRDVGCQILSEASIVDLYGTQLLLMHGDALCSNDLGHMWFRKLTLNPFFQRIFLSLPLSIRLKIAHRLRGKSQQRYHQIPQENLQIVETTVSQYLAKSNVTHLIHGHIHQPEILKFQHQSHPAERIVLGSWEEQGCLLKWYENGKKELVYFC